jgi:hypothetical protein
MILVTGGNWIFRFRIGYATVKTGRHAFVVPLRAVIRKYLISWRRFKSQIDWVDADMMDIFALEDALKGINAGIPLRGMGITEAGR